MAELTLESLAKRVEALEKGGTLAKPGKAWRKSIGMFRDSEFMRDVDDECARSRDAEREAARRGEFAE